MLNEISQSLYFKGMGNNEGVLTTLVDTAEEEESKEAILGYYFLFQSNGGMTSTNLDKKIEDWIEKTYNIKINFEVKDAIKKLKELRILSSDLNGLLTVLDLKETLKKLDSIWDDSFNFTRE